jgi:glycosyltransferase involved in cell wall biosynthesis
MRILLIHCHYRLHGGEDSVVEQELQLLRQTHSVEILRFQNHGGWKGAIQFLFSIWNKNAANKVISKIKHIQPDVIHIHNWHFALGPLVFRVINCIGIPVVHTLHNYRLLCPSAILLNNGRLFTDSLNQSFPWKAVLNKVYRSSRTQTFWLAFIVWFHKKIGTWKKIDLYLCLTPFAVEVFQHSNFCVAKEQFVVKPNFTAKPEAIQSILRKKHFLFIGRLSEEKGIDMLLRAFKDLPFLLKIAGDGPMKNEVINASNQFTNITYLGNLSNNEVLLALQKTQALLFPSVWYEGMPLTLLEAFSTGTPVLASKLGAMTSLIIDGYNGLHFELGNDDYFKEMVSHFNLLSITKKEQMSINALEEYNSKYSPELQLAYFDSIYSKVLKINEQ